MKYYKGDQTKQDEMGMHVAWNGWETNIKFWSENLKRRHRWAPTGG